MKRMRIKNSEQRTNSSASPQDGAANGINYNDIEWQLRTDKWQSFTMRLLEFQQQNRLSNGSQREIPNRRISSEWIITVTPVAFSKRWKSNIDQLTAVHSRYSRHCRWISLCLCTLRQTARTQTNHHQRQEAVRIIELTVKEANHRTKTQPSSTIAVSSKTWLITNSFLQTHCDSELLEIGM